MGAGGLWPVTAGPAMENMDQQMDPNLVLNKGIFN